MNDLQPTPGTGHPPADIVEAIRPLIELAIAEDIGPGDATSEAVLPAGLTLHGRITAKSIGAIAGLPVAEAVFSRVEPALRFTSHIHDGASVKPGDLVAEVAGPGRGMLSAERIALNFLQRLSGIATLTQAFVDAIAGTQAIILDTRKTHPGYRVLEKYAVRMGGGQNHRLGLYDMLLVKDNHTGRDAGCGPVGCWAGAAGSLGQHQAGACRRHRRHRRGLYLYRRPHPLCPGA